MATLAEISVWLFVLYMVGPLVAYFLVVLVRALLGRSRRESSSGNEPSDAP